MPSRFMPAGLHGTAGVFGAIAGCSRSGKTLSALRLMRGIVGPTGKIAVIDTEGGRMSHYAQHPSRPEIPGEKYHFDEYRMKSPFHPQRFADLLNEAEADQYAGAVVDSFSLEWTGIGGVHDLHDRELERLIAAAAAAAEEKGETLRAGAEMRFNDLAWRFAKRPHRLMRDRLLQSSMPVIFCIRSNEVPKHLTQNPRAEGRWKVEQDKRFIYEWTFALTLHPNTPGQPRYDLKTPEHEDAWKMPSYFRPFFPEKQYITEDAGAAIAAWRNSDGVGAKRTVRDIVRDRCAAAGDDDDIRSIESMDAFRVAMEKAPQEIRDELRAMVDGAKARIAADKGRSDKTVVAGLPVDAGEAPSKTEDESDPVEEDTRSASLAAEEAETRLQGVLDQFGACKTEAQIAGLSKAPGIVAEEKWLRDWPALHAKLIAGIDARREALAEMVVRP